MADPRPADVIAVVVTYHPEPEATGRLLAALAHQVAGTVVVDNGSPPASLERLADHVHAQGAELIGLGENRGIAAAQNIGIARARERGASMVLLSDQDSLPAPDMVARLLDGFVRAAADPTLLPPAAVGPVTVDARNEGAALLFAARRWGPRRADLPDGDDALVDVVFLLASGCLVDLAALDVVGPMNVAWFIDHIDLEWGLRARRAGYGLYGVTGAHLAHALGDRTQRIPGRARDVHVHSPVRNYYMARNTVALIRSGLLPVAWRWGYAAWIVKYAGFYVLGAAPRARRAGLLARGIADGLRGRSGPLTEGRR